ncbi:unnamed protein product [Durusdinium trenchii]|uniref:Uncharacterized protein n=1 Tax=Durusdinium trenchii TaxID=1381693 RepID=A0ABP0PNJ3_9DINO
MSCSTHCAPNCISRQPPGNDVVEDPPRKNAGRTYPVADPVDLQLNWQTIAVRHAWRKAAEMGDAGIGPPLPVKGLHEEAGDLVESQRENKRSETAKARPVEPAEQPQSKARALAWDSSCFSQRIYLSVLRRMKHNACLSLQEREPRHVSTCLRVHSCDKAMSSKSEI